MSSTRRIFFSAILYLVCHCGALADGYILGLGAAADSEDGLALSAFGDLGIRENTWLSATIGSTETESLAGGFSTTFADVGIDHYFKPFGLRIGVAYWGDSNILDSDDVRASLYLRNEAASFSADYERRNFDFVFGADLPRGARKNEFHADGWGMTNQLQFGDRLVLRLGGMYYEYSRDIRIQPDIDALRFLSASRLSLINSLLEYRLNAGIEYRFGLRSVDFSVGSWKTAVDQGKVNSFAIGFLTPMSDRTDLEFRFSFDDSENFGNTTALTVYLYYFGGN